MENLKIEMRKVSDLKEYANNARKITDRAVEYVAQSIREFGFLNPVVITADGTLVCGHVSTRAAKLAGVEEIPCVLADDLTPDQIKAFRLADNKTAAMAIWDMDKLRDEMAKLAGTEFTMEGMGFDARMLGDVGGLQTGVDISVDNSAPGTGVGGAGRGIENTSEELDLDGDFGDDAFEHVCPHCGLKF